MSRELPPPALQALAANPDALEYERIEALRLLSWTGGEMLTRPVTDAAIELGTFAEDPDTRVEVWGAIKGAANFAFVEPLSYSLVYDQSDAVRREAAITLADYAEDPAVRASLQLATANDSSADVRRMARWSLLDEDGRRELIVSTLLDASLPHEERLAPLRENDARVNANFVNISIDGSALDALSEIATEASDASVRSAALNEMVGGWVVRPETPAIYLDRLRNDPDAGVRSTAARLLRGYVDRPEVLAALEEAAQRDPSLRYLIDNALGRAPALTLP